MRKIYKNFIHDLLQGYIHQRLPVENQSVLKEYFLTLLRTNHHQDRSRLVSAKQLNQIHTRLMNEEIDEPEYIKQVYGVAVFLAEDDSRILFELTDFMIKAASDAFFPSMFNNFRSELKAYKHSMLEEHKQSFDWSHAQQQVSDDITGEPYVFTSEEAANIYLSLHTISWSEFRNDLDIMHNTCLSCAQELRESYGDEMTKIATKKLKQFKARAHKEL